MASIRTRTTSTGETRFAVLWREQGKQHSLTFTDGEKAERFKLDLKIDGSDAAFARLQQGGGPDGDTAGWTVETWVENYITHLTGIHDGTRADYRRLYRRYWHDPLGRLPLPLVTRDHVAAAQNKLTARGLKPKTIANARGLLAAAIVAAQTDGLIDHNPCRGLKIARTADPDEMVCLDYAEFNRLHKAIAEHYRPLVLFLVGTGTRWGEATGLRVADVHLADETVSITTAWKRIPGEGLVRGPVKTRAGRRTIKLPPELVDTLRPLVQAKRKTDLVFTTERGNVIHIAPFWRRIWVPAVDNAGLDRRPRVHDLRHTHASWLIAAGISLTVIQRRLGHETIITTSDTYGHLLPDVVEASAQAASVVFSRLGADPVAALSELAADADAGEVIDVDAE